MNVAQFAFAVEDFLAPFAGHAEGFGKGAKELDDLRNVVVVFAVLCARLGVKKIVARDELKCLMGC